MLKIVRAIFAGWGFAGLVVRNRIKIKIRDDIHCSVQTMRKHDCGTGCEK